MDESKCVACGACAKACPKGVIELRGKGIRGLRVYVSCINRDKGAVARKACKAACIGCGLCAKNCPHDAIVVENNVAYIDYTKCKLCRKCVAVCPTGAIHDVNFPKPVEKAKPAPKPAAPAAAPKPAPADPAAAPVAKPVETAAKPVVAAKPVEAEAKPTVKE